jgi:hypothetical protein
MKHHDLEYQLLSTWDHLVLLYWPGLMGDIYMSRVIPRAHANPPLDRSLGSFLNTHLGVWTALGIIDPPEDSSRERQSIHQKIELRHDLEDLWRGIGGTSGLSTRISTVSTRGFGKPPYLVSHHLLHQAPFRSLYSQYHVSLGLAPRRCVHRSCTLSGRRNGCLQIT